MSCKRNRRNFCHEEAEEIRDAQPWAGDFLMLCTLNDYSMKHTTLHKNCLHYYLPVQ